MVSLVWSSCLSHISPFTLGLRKEAQQSTSLPAETPDPNKDFESYWMSWTANATNTNFK